ncbi:MAG TPA: protein kinase [Vicinamibacterales bacterium]|nr:protein kinase [Vicinamibacterales bacterium]
MALEPGARVGAYQIVEAIGAGGMGRVYKGFDPALNRHVAIKVLPELFAVDPDRLARFEREAQLLAALNHALIAQVYGFEKSGETRALIMELVEGDTLEQRIAAGPLPVAEALQIARQIAEALEAAHESGIVHRDLKPANVKVRGDDSVKVLDFGLAKALDPSAASLAADPLNSPTLTAHATRLGVVLGTAAYMSPEQARGKLVDRRADVWAFGVVLYEMLMGRRPFQGEDVSETMAAVLRETVDFGALPSETPTQVRELLQRCLERDVRQRLRDIGEARVLIDRVIAGRSTDSGRAPGISAPAAAAGTPRPLRRVAAAAIVVGAAAGLLLFWARTETPALQPPTTLLADIGVDASLLVDQGAAAVLSPDGRTIVFRAEKDGRSRLYIRRLDALQATSISGTDEASGPFFSPDGRWIAFFAGNRLKKVAVTGGAPVDLAEGVDRGGAWTDDDFIVFVAALGPRNPLMRVPARGGTPEPATTLSGDEVVHRWPQALPGGKILYTANSTPTAHDGATIKAQGGPGGGSEGRTVVTGGYHARYVGSGHLLYVHQGTLYAIRFDLDRLEAHGEPVPVIEGVAASAFSGGAQFSVSEHGTLVHSPGTVTSDDTRIHWLTADGKTSVLHAPRDIWSTPGFSPDGRQLAYTIQDGRHLQIVVYDVERGTAAQLTFGTASHTNPVWTPDGHRLIYASDEGQPGVSNLYWRPADGSGTAERLTSGAINRVPWSVHPQTWAIAHTGNRPGGRSDVWVLPMDAAGSGERTPGEPHVLVATDAVETMPVFSPDGRWLAYQSNEDAGSFSVFVRSYPGSTGKWLVSAQNSIHPAWSRKRAEIYVSVGGQILAVPFTADAGAFRPLKARPWSSLRYSPGGALRPTYAPHPDGDRMIVLGPGSAAMPEHDRVVFVFNFFDELRRRVQ